MTTIFFVRHGENIANITKEFSYKQVDYSLTDKGRLQAQQTALFFTRQRITHIYSSPLKRAYETADIIGRHLRLPVAIREDFREINVGCFEGQRVTTQLWKQYLNITTAWEHGELSRTFPGGENYTELLARMKRGLNELQSTLSRDARVIIVGHGGMVSATIHDICPNVKRAELACIENHNCSITNIERFEEQMCLRYWAKHDHLSGEATDLISGLPNIS